ncbi:glycine dehydrogenase (aminomethyl-transferring), partial [Nocardia sp. NPDC059239]
WYTAYTPYQPEISQGRLEALLTFQTVIENLTALPIAGASLLDEATAVMEAVLLMRRANKTKSSTPRVIVDAETLPQTLAVVHGRAKAIGIDVEVADLAAGLPEGDFFGLVLQAPGTSGVVRDHGPVIAEAKDRGALTTVAADLLSLTLLTPPGEQGADIAVGSAQRFGVPLFFGGPHAGYMAVRDGLERMLPGRLVGVSVDVEGNPAYRLALQTREQHIRRDKATSNICTAQALLANVAAMYAVYHGPEGLRAIAERIHAHATALAAGLRSAGHDVVHQRFFDTVLVHVPDAARGIVDRADRDGINLRYVDADHVAIACDECTTDDIVARVLAVFGAAVQLGSASALDDTLRRTTSYLRHAVFHSHRSETAMLRFLRALSDKDLALDRTMIPLGSCTMKLNSAVEMEPISWPGFASIHPYAPIEQTSGYLELIRGLEQWLSEITGYDRVSLQPNAGSQGELAGLLAINGYHESCGDTDRDICLIPQSAHGTNAASAVLAGMRV